MTARTRQTSDQAAAPDAGGLRRAGAQVAADGAPPIEKLTRRADFLAAASARRTGTPGAGLQARWRGPGSDTTIRFGITCSKKVGNAVARNRAKRRLRALARVVLPEAGRPGWDYVLIGRPGETGARDFARMRREIATALARLHDGPARGRP